MEEHRSNDRQFAGVNTLQKRIEELTKERDSLDKDRQDAQTRMLEDHGLALAEMKITLATVVANIKDLPRTLEVINTRLTAQEKWKSWLGGNISAFGIIGVFLGFIVTLIVNAWFKR